MKPFGFAVLLFIFWMLLSGHTSPLLIGLGIASVALTIFLSIRMNVIDHESYPIQISSKLPNFFVYISREIVKANIDVVKRIVTNEGKNISPQVVELPVSQESDLGRVMYANSITLTPGTVSIELSDDKVLVHALSKEGADDLASGEMAKSIPERIQKMPKISSQNPPDKLDIDK